MHHVLVNVYVNVNRVAVNGTEQQNIETECRMSKEEG
jgi:hypothetical protein